MSTTERREWEEINSHLNNQLQNELITQNKTDKLQHKFISMLIWKLKSKNTVTVQDENTKSCT